MNRKLLVLASLSAIALIGMIGVATKASAATKQQGSMSSSSCDRACLDGFVDKYLDAVVAHDPSQIPVTKFVKFTENGQQIELGDGFWRTATARGKYKFYVDDVPAGQVGFLGTMEEAGQPVIVALRLKIAEQKVSEVETIVARGGMATGGGKNLEKMGSPRRAFLEDVPEANRVSRLELIKTANKYFSGMQQDNGKGDYCFSPTIAIAWKMACKPRTI